MFKDEENRRVDVDSTPLAERLFDLARADGASGDVVQAVVLPLAVMIALRFGMAEPKLLPFLNSRRSKLPSWDGLVDPERLRRTRPGELIELACLTLGVEADWTRDLAIQHGRVLSEIAHWIGSMPIASRSDADVLESVLGKVIHLSQRNRFGGEYATAPALAQLMVALADIRPGQTIYDPCCGVGELLVSAARVQAAKHAGRPAADYSSLHFGIERLPALAFIARVRLALAAGRPSVTCGDALATVGRSGPLHDGYDVVLIDPPRGVRLDDPTHVELPIRSKSAEVKFVQHGLAALRPTGTAVFALPPGVLFRDGAEKQLRQVLVDNYGLSVVAVVPSVAVRSTNLPTALLVARRQRRSANTLFLSVKSPPSSEEAVARIVSAAEAGDLRPESYDADDQMLSAHSAAREDIVANDYNLDARRYTASHPANALDELERTVEMRPLKTIAKVIAGASLGRASMTDVERYGRPIIRVSDVDPKAPLQLGKRFLVTHKAPNVREDQSVRGGDILLTIDGTIGKVHAVATLFVNGEERRVDDDPRPLIAKGVVAIRVESSDVDPRFLSAVLRSQATQDRLRQLARGVGIPHVSLRDVRELRLPVPAVDAQHRVVRRLAEQGGDAVEVLALVLSGQDGDELASLFRDHPAFLRLAGEGEPDQKELEPLALEALDVLRRLRNDVAHAGSSSARIALDFQPWLLRVGALPVGTFRRTVGGEARYDALAASTELLDAAVVALKPVTGLIARQATRLTLRLAQWTQVAQARLADDFILEARQVPLAGGAEGATTEIEIVLRGQGALRDVHVFTSAGWELGHPTSQGRLPLRPTEPTGDVLAAGRPMRVLLRQIDDTAEQRLELLRLPWKAIRLDGSHAAGEVSCDLAPLQRSLFEPRQPLGVSPYITGSVIEDPSMFFGRAGVLEDIRTHIGGGTKVILLEGNRRTGKTSILRRIQAADFGLLQEWVPVECSFQAAVGDERKDGVATKDLFRLIVREIGIACSKAGTPVPLPGMPIDLSPTDFKFAFVRALNAFFEGIDPYEALQLYVDLVTERIAPKRLLLMFDEFDKLQVGIDNGVTSPQVPENIRNLLQTRSAVAAILTGSRRLKRLREEYWSALFGFGHRIGIDPLQRDEARDLITRPVRDRLVFSTPAIESIIRLTASQPFLLQSLCARVFEVAKGEQQRRVDSELVERAAKRMVHDNEHFQALWSYAETERRRYLLCLCDQLEGGDTRVSADLLAQRLETAGAAVSVDAVDDDLKMLLELEIVRLTNTETGAQYGLAVPLMRMWMQETVDGEAQRRRAVREEQARSAQ